MCSKGHVCLLKIKLIKTKIHHFATEVMYKYIFFKSYIEHAVESEEKIKSVGLVIVKCTAISKLQFDFYIHK